MSFADGLAFVDLPESWLIVPRETMIRHVSRETIRGPSISACRCADILALITEFTADREF
jgi:hypothetical protein